MRSRPTHPYHPSYWLTWLGMVPWRAAAALPLPASAALGALIGDLARRLAADRRRVAERNLQRCFPAWSAEHRGRVLREHFRAAGQSILDLGVVVWSSHERLRRLIRLQGYDHVAVARDRGRGVILLAPHFVTLPVGALYLCRQQPMVTMYKRPRNEVIHEGYRRVCTGEPSRSALINLMFHRASERHPLALVEHRQGLRPIITRMRAGAPFYYLPDQDLGRRQSVFAPFFGIPAATASAVGRFARMTDAVVMLCHTRQLPRGGGYEVTIGAPFENYPTGDPVEDATRMNSAIETAIRTMPEQYFWLHQRFKTRPPGEKDFYA